ncbi:MAG: lytic murein transglycosylase B [Neisseriaceae bacterium]|nr:lytic murein transglycosylase B [Neisseriaceae bacterium]
MKKLTLPLIIATLFFQAACATQTQPLENTPKMPTAQTTPSTPQPQVQNEPLPPCNDQLCFIQRSIHIATQDEWANFFNQVEYKDNIIEIITRPATSRPWYRFAVDNASAKRINEGVAFYRQNQSVALQAEQNYGVPASVMTAILGIETHYGRNMGSFRVADALNTLAFNYTKRLDFFQDELRALMQMSKELNRNPLDFTGSYAGAMGMPQFMPSSYRQWAKDGDGDGFADIWQSRADAYASVGNYLKEHGWKTGGQVFVPLYPSFEQMPQLDAFSAEKTGLNHTVGEFRQIGLNIPPNIQDDEKAMIYRLETAPNEFSYYLGLNNFYVIWQYNNSRMYVHAVGLIANGIRQGVSY